jgi:urea transport system substrate-binding protein
MTEQGAEQGSGLARREFLKRGTLGLVMLGGIGSASGLLAACGGSSSAGNASGGGSSRDPLKVGLLVPLSGGYEVYGTQAKRGAELAAAEINAAGGVVGRKIQFVVEDTTNTPQVASQKLQKLVLQDKVTFTIGPQSSAEREAVIDFAMAHKHPLIYYISYEGGACDQYLYCFGPTPATSIEPYLSWLIANHGKRIFFTGWDYVANQVIGDGLKKWVPAAGGELVGQELVPFTTTDFGPQLRKAQATNPDIVFNGMYGAPGLQETFTQFGMKDKTHLAGWALDRAQVEALSPDAAANLSWCADWEDTTTPLSAPANKKFLDSMHKMFGPDITITGTAVDTYVGLHMYASAINKASSTDADKASTAIDGSSFEGPGGRYTLSSDNHNVDAPAYVFTTSGVKAGKVDVLMAKDLGEQKAAPACGRKWQH